MSCGGSELDDVERGDRVLLIESCEDSDGQMRNFNTNNELTRNQKRDEGAHAC